MSWLAEQIDPEDWTALINEAFDLMSRAVFRYEGTIAQLQGDALLAFFGAPVAHEDDPERAILAALDMFYATDEFARQLKATQGIDFRIRAGINSGPVMVGNVGSDLRYEYTALGDAVNVAARMQTAAEPGTILITEMTRRLTGDTFDLDDLGEIEVKGKTEPIHAFRVIGRKAAPARRRGLESVGLDSPMVGRAEQLERLTSLLDIIAAGRGRVAFIVGEPGIGKSRLLAELKIAALAPPSTTRWFEGAASRTGATALPPAHRSAPVDPRLLVLRDESRRARRSTPPSSTSWAWTKPRPRTPRCTSPTCSDAPGGRGGDPDRSAGRAPEPLHRGDTGLASGAGRRGGLRGHPLGRPGVHRRRPPARRSRAAAHPFVAAMRAETDAPAGPSSATRGAVRRGAHRAPTRAPHGGRQQDPRGQPAGDRSLPARVRDLILARSEGNPFFVEEVVECSSSAARSCRKARAGSPPRTSPRSRSRRRCTGCCWRDRPVPDDAKRSLRVAAVIGRQFPVRVLERVIGAEP